MFTGRAVTATVLVTDHFRVFLHCTRTVARAASVLALSACLVLPTAAAHAAPSSAAPRLAPAAGSGDANGGAGDGRLTFGMTTASSGAPDDRGFIAVDAPPGSTVSDSVGVVNMSDAPLDVDLYTADVVNAKDGALDAGRAGDKKSLAGAWVTLPEAKVSLPAQSSKGPGVAVVPVTITIPKNAEPGDHLAGVLSSVTAAGRPGVNAPTVDLEQRVGVRVYVRVQGDIRAGLTITDVRADFRAGSPFGPGTVNVTYTLTNSGNVRFGVHPAVRASGIFGLMARSAKGRSVDELLPHASVTQTVTIPHVYPLVLDNVVVSGAAVAARGADDPGLGTVHASSWTWAWSWLVLIVILVVAAAVAEWRRRRRRNQPGVWGPPEGLWGDSASTSPAGTGTRAATEPEQVR
jgi:hypothetical protein